MVVFHSNCRNCQHGLFYFLLTASNSSYGLAPSSHNHTYLQQVNGCITLPLTPLSLASFLVKHLVFVLSLACPAVWFLDYGFSLCTVVCFWPRPVMTTSIGLPLKKKQHSKCVLPPSPIRYSNKYNGSICVVDIVTPSAFYCHCAEIHSERPVSRWIMQQFWKICWIPLKRKGKNAAKTDY